MKNVICAFSMTAFALLLSSEATFAGTTSISAGKGVSKPEPAKVEASAYDKIWALPSLYKSETGLLNELRIIGRYQGQYYDAESDSSEASDYSTRRARLGLRAVLFDKTLTFNTELSSADKFDPTYAETTEAWLEYKPSSTFSIRAGKFMPGFGYDYGTSSRDIITFERSLLPNSMNIFFTPGVRVTSVHGDWTLTLSAFSNNPDKEFGGLDGGWSILPSIAYDAAKQIGMDKAIIRLDYLHSDHESGDTRLATFNDAVSLNFQGKQGKLGLNADLMGTWADRGDAAMLMLMPTYDITDKLQAVVRYTYVTGDEGAVVPQRRYESTVGGKAGDAYQAIYGGLNYYFYGHKLKAMLGAEYSSMDGGEDTTTLLAGLRIYW